MNVEKTMDQNYIHLVSNHSQNASVATGHFNSQFNTTLDQLKHEPRHLKLPIQPSSPRIKKDARSRSMGSVSSVHSRSSSNLRDPVA